MQRAFENCMETRKYPISVQTFELLREEGFVYVDKTDLIYRLAQQHVCFLCRPRRFGKSLALSTLDAYFSGKQHLFDGLKIVSLEHDWNVYPVFHLDFNSTNFLGTDALERLLTSYVSEKERAYKVEPDSNLSIGMRFAKVLHAAYVSTGMRAVVLIDEYDKPILDVLGDPMEEANRDILKNFYSVFKTADADLRFVLLTGVTKFSQVSVFSGFNQPYDISMNSTYEALCGITEEELLLYFSEEIELMAQQMNVSQEQMRGFLKNLYDGYHFSPAMKDVYNPFSLFNAFANMSLRNYWFASGTPTYLLKLVKGSSMDLQTMLSQDYSPEYFVDYRACVEDPLAMLYQSGYLTIKEVKPQDDGMMLYRLDYPNTEVKRGFIELLTNDYFATKESAGSLMKQMVDCLRGADLDHLRDLMNVYLSSVDYEMRKDKEYHFQYTFYLIFSLMSTYSVKVEQHNSQGRADLIVETGNRIYIFEFKLDGTAEEALEQIEDRQYALPYALCGKQIYKVGASFSKKSGEINDWKVQK